MDLSRPRSPASGRGKKVRNTIGAYGIRLIVATAAGVVLSRTLNPEGRGTYNVIVTVASTATVLGHLSIAQASVTLWSRHRSAIPTNNLVLGPLLGIAAAVLTGLAIVLFAPGIVPASARPLLFVALASVPIAVVIIHLTTVALLLGRVDAANRSMTVSAILQCGALLALVVSGHPSTAAVIWIWVVSGAVPLLMLAPVLRPHFARGDLGLARRMVGAGLRYQVGQFSLNLLTRVDVLILNAMAPGSPVGLYTLAVSVGGVTCIATSALAQVVLSDQAGADLERAARVTGKSIRVSVIMAIPLIAVLCVTAPWLVPALYGTDYRGSVPAIFALAPGVLAISATRSLLPYLLRLDRPWLVSGTSLLALMVNVGLNLLLIPRWGVVGCAGASSAGWLVLAGCQVAWFAKATGTSPAELLPGRGDLARAWSETVALSALRCRPGGLVGNRPGCAATDASAVRLSTRLEQEAAPERTTADNGSTGRRGK